ncbi:RmlC-like cupin domain-containing protein [Bisporella sp. PMI_857]|nr:RmlC-like cupin domain-containing protein [Bisporella sp. PMI_857]
MEISPSAQDVIAALNLIPHPEKGYFIETFRDTEGTTEHQSHSTCIYYLLEGDSGVSHWHRVLDAVEVWHHYAGAPLKLSLSCDDGKPIRHVVLGKDIWSGQKPQAVVHRKEWQHAQSLGAWTLVGCTVAPAFTMENFEMAQEGWEPRGADDATK